MEAGPSQQGSSYQFGEVTESRGDSAKLPMFKSSSLGDTAWVVPMLVFWQVVVQEPVMSKWAWKVESELYSCRDEPHPTQQVLLHTMCCFPKDFRGMLKDHGNIFKFRPSGRGRDAKAGRMKLRPHGIDLLDGALLPDQEVYISRLLCYMYRGPPANPTLEACHMCENQMCLAPWHMCWATRSSNKRGHDAHRGTRKRYHPCNLA